MICAVVVPHGNGGLQRQQQWSCGGPTYEGSPHPLNGQRAQHPGGTSAPQRLPCSAVGLSSVTGWAQAACLAQPPAHHQPVTWEGGPHVPQ